VSRGGKGLRFCEKLGVHIHGHALSGRAVRLRSNLSRGGGGVLDGVVVHSSNLMHVSWNDGGCGVFALVELT
jgi:hypothetical protein